MKTLSELPLGEAPVIGETYLVPCMDVSKLDYPNTFSRMFRENAHLLTDVPVIGTVHRDPEFPGSGGEKRHAHVDVRFMAPHHMLAWDVTETGFLASPSRIPFIPIIPTIAEEQEYPEPQLIPMVCHRQMPDHTNTVLAGQHYSKFEDSMEDYVLKADHPICPHQGTPLVGIEPVNGIIHCPTHGLGFCPKSGKVVRKTVSKRTGDPYLYSPPESVPQQDRRASCS